MIPWVTFLKWLLQPKNMLVTGLVMLVLVLSVGQFLASKALDRAKIEADALIAQNKALISQSRELRANIENIKKQNSKIQVIERNTHTIREIVKQVPVEDKNCEKSPEFKEAAGAVVDYFNSSDGGVQASNDSSGAPILPTPGTSGPGSADD